MMQELDKKDLKITSQQRTDTVYRNPELSSIDFMQNYKVFNFNPKRRNLNQGKTEPLDEIDYQISQPIANTFRRPFE